MVYDNFSEAYHIPVAHPKLALVLEQEMVEFREEKRWTFNRFKSKQGFPGLELEYGSPYYAWQAWPHLCMLSLPGSENLIVLRMAPDGVGACAERVDIYTPAGESERHPKLQAVRDLFMDMFNIEDISIAESVQRGLSSMGYDQGRYVCDPSTSWFSEIQLHWFPHAGTGRLADRPEVNRKHQPCSTGWRILRDAGAWQSPCQSSLHRQWFP